MFGFRETIRKERERRERLKNSLFSIVWFASNKIKKESFEVGPMLKTFLHLQARKHEKDTNIMKKSPK